MSLEQFIETLDNVPSELTRSFNLIKDLDERTKELNTEINENVKKYRATNSKSERMSIKKDIDDLFNRILSLADDKLEQTQQTYDMIDKHIRRLTSLQSETNTPDEEAAEQQDKPMIGFEMPSDPNEPRYCICREISYGMMIACANKECITEWFHYPCVGITEPPNGDWYCGTCLPLMKKQKSRSKRNRRR